MTRAVLGFALLLAAYRVGHWVGVQDERHTHPVAVCPKVETRVTPSGRLDTLTTIPEDCR